VNNPLVLSLEGGNAQPLSVRAKALVFSDPKSEALLNYIERISPSDAPVLIGGETGTGKELVARHIHLLSGRKGPFLAINCGAISEQLAESELFGHEAGAFTGAQGKREGWFEAANGGTLFLDEIGDLPLNLQVKLLRVLQEREVVRIGSRKTIAVDVRLVAASNVDLAQAVNAGQFRRDLLYRLNIAQVYLPPLRERPGDIFPLVQHFIKIYAARMNILNPEFTQDARALLLNYGWPGNIRELENVVHFALLVAGNEPIDSHHLRVTGGWNVSGEGRSHNAAVLSNVAVTPHGEKLRDISVQENSLVDGSAENLEALEINASEQALRDIAGSLKTLFSEKAFTNLYDQLEKLIVDEAYGFNRHNQVHTAHQLGISRNVLRTLLKRHGYLAETNEFTEVN
jgi:transcriptional regulator with PAS, ATPase and Fis domain